MRNMKKGMAVTLAAALMLGSTLTVSATGGTGATPNDAATGSNVTSGSATGAGESVGHLEKKVTNVILPTDGDTTTFAYTIDPERLIQDTDGAGVSNADLPAKDTDTGVYFMTDTNKYENASKALTVTNKSSHDIKLTVKAKASEADTDIPLAEKEDITGTDAKLYLGLKLGDKSAAVATTEVSVDTSVAGIPENFETTFENGKYAYKEIADGTTGKKAWKSASFNMEGACTTATVASDLTAPTITVTWKFEEVTGPQVTIASDGWITISGLTAANNYKSTKIVDGSSEFGLDQDPNAQWDGDWTQEAGGTLRAKLNDSWINALKGTSTAKIVVTLQDDTTIEKSLVGVLQ